MNLTRSGTRAFLLLCMLRTGAVQAQSLPKLERKAINRTNITLVNGDTVQRFTTTLRQPKPKPDRFYYWQGQEQILRTVGAYNGHLLHGAYRLTDRTDRLLGAGTLKKGLKTGVWRKWRADGSLVSASRWRRGRQVGLTTMYDANSRQVPAAKKTHQPAAAPRPHWWQVGLRKKKAPIAPSSKSDKAKEALKSPVASPASSPVPSPKPGS